MKVRLTLQAEVNLTAIADYVRERSPACSLKIRDDILKTLEVLAAFPNSGRVQNVEGVQKVVTSRYRYILYYMADSEANEIGILTIQHPARQRQYKDKSL